MTNKQKSMYKSISYRVISILLTFAIGYAVTGSTATASIIVGIDSVFKVVFYYYHERIWSKIYNKLKEPKDTSKGMMKAHKQ